MRLNIIENKDCLKAMAQLPSESIDLVVTDPPYLIGYKSNNHKNKEHKFCHEIEGDRNPELIRNYIRECYRLLKPNTAMYMFCSDKTSDYFKEECRQAGFNIKNAIVWVKDNHTMGDLKAAYGRRYEVILYLNKGRCPLNGKRLSDVWTFKRIPSCRQVHQNQKLLDLIKQCVVKSSKMGGVILDGFMGSGTTAVACLETGRNYIGYEIDKEYYDIAIKRIHRYGTVSRGNQENDDGQLLTE